MSSHHAQDPECARFEALLPLAAQNLLAAHHAEQLKVHLEGCARCRADLASYQSLDEALRQLWLASPEVSIQTEDIMASLARRNETPDSPSKRFQISSVLPIAATIMIITLAFLLFHGRFNEPTPGSGHHPIAECPTTPTVTAVVQPSPTGTTSFPPTPTPTPIPPNANTSVSTPPPPSDGETGQSEGKSPDLTATPNPCATLTPSTPLPTPTPILSLPLTPTMPPGATSTPLPPPPDATPTSTPPPTPTPDVPATLTPPPSPTPTPIA